MEKEGGGRKEGEGGRGGGAGGGGAGARVSTRRRRRRVAQGEGGGGGGEGSCYLCAVVPALHNQCADQAVTNKKSARVWPEHPAKQTSSSRILS